MSKTDLLALVGRLRDMVHESMADATAPLVRDIEAAIEGLGIEASDFVFDELKEQLVELRKDNRALRDENLETWRGAKDLVLECTRLKEALRRNGVLLHAWRLLPATINSLARREIFIQSRADTDMLDALAELFPKDEMTRLCAILQCQEGGQQLAALLLWRYEEFWRKKKRDDDAAEAFTRSRAASYEEGERDAAGQPPKDGDG